MKIRIFILLVFSFVFHSAISQNDSIRSTAYMSIKKYRERHKAPLTQKDSINFLYKENDTLVLLENYNLPEGVIVPYEYKDSTFLHYYTKIAFRKQGIDSLDNKEMMKYWKKPIKIYFSNSVSNKVKKDFISFTKQITNNVDSLSISKVNKLEDSNYIIYYKDDYEYEKNLKEKVMSDSYIAWKKNIIYTGSIKINTDNLYNDKLILSQLKVLFLQSLGYFKLINDFTCENYFSNCYSDEKKLTKLDLEILKYHYSYGICKGTTLKTFLQQHKESSKLFLEKGLKSRFIHKQ